MRCARCLHSWHHELPKEMDAVGATAVADVTPEPQIIPPLPPGSGLPVPHHHGRTLQLVNRIIFFGGVLLLVGLLGWLIFGRKEIVKDQPFMERFYDLIGLHIFRPGEGLSFVQARSEIKDDQGARLLAVEGKVKNGTDEVQLIPPIVATAIGADGNVIQSWQFDASAAKVFPGEAVKFNSFINAPSGNVREVKFDFVEPKEDDAHE